MYKHILVPTDGSPLAAKGVEAAIAFAAEVGAKVTGYYAIEDMNMHHAGAHLTKDLIAEFEKRANAAAEVHAREGMTPTAADLTTLATVLTTRAREAQITAGKSGNEADTAVELTHDKMVAATAPGSAGADQYDIAHCYDLSKPAAKSHY